jgi:hypothetical protein
VKRKGRVAMRREREGERIKKENGEENDFQV